MVGHPGVVPGPGAVAPLLPGPVPALSLHIFGTFILTQLIHLVVIPLLDETKSERVQRKRWIRFFFAFHPAN